jgi:phosphate transport system substrate-binding protein
MSTGLSSDMKVTLTDTEAAEGYPLAGFTWVLLYKEQAYQGHVEEKARELVRLVRWMTHEGQKYAEPMQYTPLSKAVVAKAETLIESVTYDGKSLSR